MPELTAFQEKKILRVFSMLYDCNSDGVIEKQDFDILLQKICKILEWQNGGEKYNNARDTMETVWKGLLDYADTNKDAKITTDEWLKMWGDCLDDLEKGHLPDWHKKYMDLMFDVNDKSGDELIDKEEYTTFLSNFEISESDCHKAFGLISRGSDITRDNFATLWTEYLTSTDTSAPGNFLFGPVLD